MATNFAPQISPPLSAEEAASQQEDKPTTPSDAVMGEAADLGAMFRVLDALQPDAAEDTAGKTYRPSFDPWPDGDEDLPPEAEENGEWCAASGGRVSVIGEFERAAPVPVCAVDAGIVRLGKPGKMPTSPCAAATFWINKAHVRPQRQCCSGQDYCASRTVAPTRFRLFMRWV